MQRKLKHAFYVQYIYFFNSAICDIMWKNFIQPRRPQITIWRMRIACWIAKATNTHSEYVILNPVYYNNVCINAPQSYSIQGVTGGTDQTSGGCSLC